MNTVFFRAFELEDYKSIYKWRNDPELMRMVSGAFRQASSEIEKEWVKAKAMDNTHDVYMAICLNDDSRRMIGYFSINGINYINRTAEFGGLTIGEKEYRDGLCMIETYQFVYEYVFERLNLNRLSGTYLIGHKVTEIIGEIMFVKTEGVMKKAIYKNGQYYDLAMTAILRDDYMRHKLAGDYETSAIMKRLRQIKKKI